MSVTTVAALFETNFIILQCFSSCHVKAAFIIKCSAKNSQRDRANMGSGGVATSRRSHRGLVAKPLALCDFYDFFNKNDEILSIFEPKFLL